jgi:hypothetical protein
LKLEQKHIALGALAAIGIIVIWHFTRKGNGVSEVSPQVPDAVGQLDQVTPAFQTYPSAPESANPANIEVGGSPIYLNYNTPVDGGTHSAEGCGGDCACGGGNSIGTPAVVNKINLSPDAIAAQLGNLQSVGNS